MRKWVIWVTASALYVLVNFHRFAMGVISDQLMAAFAIAAVGLGGLSSLYFYLYALLQMPAGILADTWGPRRTITASAVIMAAGSFVFGVAPDLSTAYVGRFLVGVGVAAVFVNILKLLADWFPPRYFATMTGLTTTVGFLGGFAASGPFAHVVEAVGWRWGFHGVGILTAVIALGCFWLIRDRPAPLPAAEESPILGSLWVVLKTPETWPVFFAKVGITGTYLAFFALWGPPYLMQVYGMTRPEAGASSAWGCSASSRGGPLSGFCRTGSLSSASFPSFWPAAVTPCSGSGPPGTSSRRRVLARTCSPSASSVAASFSSFPASRSSSPSGSASP